MPRSYIRVFAHVVFSTYERQPLITREIQPRLHAYLAGIARNLGARRTTAGGVQDHVHMLSTLPAMISVVDFINKIKANSSKWMHAQGFSSFAWQRGYGAFSVSPSMTDRVLRYIESQEEHHRVFTFREELIRFLNEAGIEYDERYILA